MDQLVFRSLYEVQQIVLPTLFLKNTDLFLSQISKGLLLDIVNQQLENNRSPFRMTAADIGYQRDRITVKKITGHVTRVLITWPKITDDEDDSDATLCMQQVFYKTGRGDFMRFYTKERTVNIADMMKEWESDPEVLKQFDNTGWMLCGVQIYGKNQDHINYGRRSAEDDFLKESEKIFRAEYLEPHKEKPKITLSVEPGDDLEDPI